VRITYLPVLRTLRELYVQPRDMQRFRRYLAALTGGTDDIVLPIGVANPMAKEHAIAKLDELLALGAEDVGAAAAAAAAARLAGRVPLELEVKASLVLVDDVAGGWTNRYTTEASVRFPGRGALRRPFATGLVWTSESPGAEQLHQEVLGAIYRVVYQQRRGLPVRLRAMLDQEGLAGLFAGARPDLAPDELARARRVVAGVGDDPGYPTAFACLYGDEAAEQLGYRPLGLPPRAGFAVALADALDRQRDPVGAVLDD
jgi:hypothetical protein